MRYTSFLRPLILIGLCAVPFISFIVAGGGGVPSLFFPFITGKNFAFRILVEVLFLAYIVLALKEPKYRPRSSVLMWTALAFAVWMGLATLFSVDMVKSFWSNFERMDGYITVLHAVVFFIIAGAMLSADKWWDIFFRATVAAGVLQGIYALMQLTGVLTISSQSGARVDTSFGNAIYVAVFMLFNIFITLYLLIRDRRLPAMQAVYGIALVLEFLAMFYSQTRGALLGVVGGLLVMGIYIAIRATEPQWKTVRMWSFGLLGGLVVLIGLFFALKDTQFIHSNATLNRIANISLSDGTTQARFTIWRDMAIPGALEKPLFGWGQENFNYVFNKYYQPSMYGQEQWFDRTHNEFLDWLISGGFPAFILYILFFLAAAWAIVRSQLSTPEQAAFLGLLAAYGFSNLTVFHDLMSFVYFFVILAFLHSQSWNPLPRFMALLKPGDDKMIAVVAPIAAIIVLTGTWMFNVPPITRAETLISALSSTDAKTGAALSPEQHFAFFKQALAEGELGKQETMEQIFQFASNSIAPSTSIPPQTKQDIFTFTRSNGDALLKQRPNDARLELFMSVFLTQFGQYDDAITYLNKALSDSPQKQQIMFQLGNLYLQKGDSAKAIEVLKKAYDLEPKYETARIMYAGALYYAGRTAEADALLMEAFKTVLYDNDQLLQVYTNTKKFDRVVGIWKARVEQSPKDSNIMLGLASAYFAAGDGPNTIATLKKVAELNPTQAGEVQNLITQIQNGTLKPGQK
jgi:tetratricopeptide (TPR) repeat protein/O-antigen ligase